MKRYDPTEKCPKCGGLMSEREWKPEREVERTEGARLIAEHILARCVACGFEVKRAPLDSEPPRAVESCRIGPGGAREG